MKIAYEPHPVSPDRKAELRAQGFKILDAVFAPEGYSDAVQTETETEAETTAPTQVRRGRPRKAD